jgi:hypothetical protein
MTAAGELVRGAQLKKLHGDIFPTPIKNRKQRIYVA